MPSGNKDQYIAIHINLWKAFWRAPGVGHLTPCQTSRHLRVGKSVWRGPDMLNSAGLWRPEGHSMRTWSPAMYPWTVHTIVDTYGDIWCSHRYIHCFSDFQPFNGYLQGLNIFFWWCKQSYLVMGCSIDGWWFQDLPNTGYPIMAGL